MKKVSKDPQNEVQGEWFKEKSFNGTPCYRIRVNGRVLPAYWTTQEAAETRLRTEVVRQRKYLENNKQGTP